MSEENLNIENLAYLAGVKKVINECGMAPMPAPNTPASINMTAASGQELSGMLKDIMSLTGVHKVEPHHMPVEPHDGHSKVISAPPMKALIDMVNDEEMVGDEMGGEKMVKDSMNRPWSNSPDEEGKQEGEFPMDGDQDNNLVAAKDEIVDRNRRNRTEESLYQEYKKFVAETSKHITDKNNKFEEGRKARDNYTVSQDPDGTPVKVYPPSGPKTFRQRARAIRTAHGSEHIGKEGENPRGDKVGSNANISGTTVARLSGGKSTRR